MGTLVICFPRSSNAKHERFENQKQENFWPLSTEVWLQIYLRDPKTVFAEVVIKLNSSVMWIDFC